jgi:hypothetical protein
MEAAAELRLVQRRTARRWRYASLLRGHPKAMQPFSAKTVKPGDAVILRARPDVGLRFKGMGHDGSVIVALEPDALPGYMPRDMIVRQRDLAIPEKSAFQTSWVQP